MDQPVGANLPESYTGLITMLDQKTQIWGKSGRYDGIWYASKAFVAYKTMNILVHKDALPKEIAKKLGIK